MADSFVPAHGSHKKPDRGVSFRFMIPTGLIFAIFVYFSYFVMLAVVENQMMGQKRETLRSMGKAVWHSSFLISDLMRFSPAKKSAWALGFPFAIASLGITTGRSPCITVPIMAPSSLPVCRFRPDGLFGDAFDPPCHFSEHKGF